MNTRCIWCDRLICMGGSRAERLAGARRHAATCEAHPVADLLAKAEAVLRMTDFQQCAGDGKAGELCEICDMADAVKRLRGGE